jgi:hypothetical protein
VRTDLIKKFNIYKVTRSFLDSQNVEIIIYKNYIKLFYIKIYIFFYFYQKKYTRLNVKALRYLRLYNKKLIKKYILKAIKFFFLKKTFTVKKLFFKKKSLRFFKFLLFSNKGYQFKILDESLIKNKQRITGGKSLLYVFLSNELAFNKKISIRKKKVQ